MSRNRKGIEEGGSPRHLWREVRGQGLRITGNQPIAREKLEIARRFRREMTPQERVLWRALRNNQLQALHFRRQQVIAGFIVDFYCASALLAIETDGDSHLGRADYDAERDRALAEMGIRTLRVSNESVTVDLTGVLRTIAEQAVARVISLPATK